MRECVACDGEPVGRIGRIALGIVRAEGPHRSLRVAVRVLRSFSSLA